MAEPREVEKIKLSDGLRDGPGPGFEGGRVMWLARLLDRGLPHGQVSGE